jgi:hypothetical protein
MTTSRKIRASKPLSEYTEEDIAAFDQFIEVPFFWGTRERIRIWRKRRALTRRAAQGDALAARELAESDDFV